MKRFCIVVLVICSAFLACSCNKNRGSSELIGEPYTQNHGTDIMCETDTAYYMVRDKGGTDRLESKYAYYCDKANLSGFFPLCNKAECGHRGNDCNAYLGNCQALAALGDKLYYASISVDENKVPLPLLYE